MAAKKQKKTPGVVTLETPAIDRPSSLVEVSTPDVMSLEGWMARLYTRACKERTLVGDLGVWPEELGPYLTLLTRCYAPPDEERPRITLAPGLIAPYPYTPAPSADAKPVLALLLSGGKDSIATGIAAEDAGYEVRAFYCAKVNHSYPFEADAVPTIAAAMGWPLTILEPAHVAKAIGNNVVKNQYLQSLALEVMARRGDVTPAAVACGNFLIDDCYTTPWFGDMQPAMAAFGQAIASATGQHTRNITLLDDVLQALRLWYEHTPDAVKQVTASCMMPPRNRTQHRRRCIEQGIPLLSQYDCGVCEKCKLRLVLLADRVGADLPWPSSEVAAKYLKNARRWLKGAYKGLSWARTHASLAVTAEDLIAAMTRATGSATQAQTLYDSGEVDWSAAYMVTIVYGGVLRVEPERSANPGIEPEVIRMGETPKSVDSGQPSTELAPVKRRQPAKKLKDNATPAPSGQSGAIRDRIKGLKWVKASELVPNPENWREHPEEQRALFRETLDAVGFAGAELTVTLPDGRLMLVDGHMRQEEMGDQPIPCLETDLTLDEARLILATFDPIAQLAGVRDQKARDLVLRVSSQSAGAGALLTRMADHSQQMRDLLLGRAGPSVPYSETPVSPSDVWDDWDGDDEAENEPENDTWMDEALGKPSKELSQPAGGVVSERYGVLAECADEHEQRRVWELLAGEGIKCRILTL